MQNSVFACTQSVFSALNYHIKATQWRQAYMQQNKMQVLDAYKLLAVLDAASLSASASASSSGK